MYLVPVLLSSFRRLRQCRNLPSYSTQDSRQFQKGKTLPAPRSAAKRGTPTNGARADSQPLMPSSRRFRIKKRQAETLTHLPSKAQRRQSTREIRSEVCQECDDLMDVDERGDQRVSAYLELDRAIASDLRRCRSCACARLT